MAVAMANLIHNMAFETMRKENITSGTLISVVFRHLVRENRTIGCLGIVPCTALAICIQYVILRGDLLRSLKWTIGAVVAQACHACSAVLHMFYSDPNVVQYTKDLDKMHKIILEASDETTLCLLAETLTRENIDYKLWIEQPENIPTCIAIKPYRKEDIQHYFKTFKLFK